MIDTLPTPNSQTSEIQSPSPRNLTHYTKTEKLRLLAEAEACQPGEQGGFLRKNGIYSSHLARWREEQAAGKLNPAINGATDPAGSAKYWQQRAETLAAELAQAHTIIAAQKKLAEVFGLLAMPYTGSK